MTARTVKTLTTVDPLPGSGILRPFPTPALAHIDPFVFLDTGAPKQLGGRDIYVGPHAHRGVQPVSLLFRGRIEHRDSLGNAREVASGGMQWLVAGSGALHEEVLHGDAQGVFHMAQLWVNVPGARKMDPPEHHALGPEAIPQVAVGSGATARLYAGDLGSTRGPAPMPTPVLVAYVQIGAEGRLEVPVPAGWNAAFTVVAGSVDIGEHDGLRPGATAVFADDGDTIQASSREGGELLLMAGEPIGEPIVPSGGFVMTSKAEIAQAFEDLHAGRMGQLAASR